MTKEEKEDIEEIVSLLTDGQLTDEKLKEASARLSAFKKLYWLFDRNLEIKEIH